MQSIRALDWLQELLSRNRGQGSTTALITAGNLNRTKPAIMVTGTHDLAREIEKRTIGGTIAIGLGTSPEKVKGLRGVVLIDNHVINRLHAMVHEDMSKLMKRNSELEHKLHSIRNIIG